MSKLFAAYNGRPRSLPKHAECQEAALQYHMNSKGLRNGKSRRHSFCGKSLTSRRKADWRGVRGQLHHAFQL